MLRAAIFDMDGLLIDSEPLWQHAERETFDGLGIMLSAKDCQKTTGLRIDEVVEYWYARHPWPSPSPRQVSQLIVRRVCELVASEGSEKPGAREAILRARALGLKLALASSSATELIDVVLEHLDIKSFFQVVHSAQGEVFGKPHPAVFLATAALLAISPAECLVLEDSLNGVIAAKAARMTCIAVPEVPRDQRAPFAIADIVVDSLLDVDDALLTRLLASAD